MLFTEAYLHPGGTGFFLQQKLAFFIAYDDNARRHGRACKAQLTIETVNIISDGD